MNIEIETIRSNQRGQVSGPKKIIKMFWKEKHLFINCVI